MKDFSEALILFLGVIEAIIRLIKIIKSKKP